LTWKFPNPVIFTSSSATIDSFMTSKTCSIISYSSYSRTCFPQYHIFLWNWSSFWI
jgi:hypothetical protein